ncbi:MAG: cache domain-containing protein [Deltaproteobacteria bacterium]|nr:cache domain-containing protein [Deltaproteobacteria bacterium]
MRETTRVDFHCHSSLSDGFYDPPQLVALLAGAHVRYAALTDHDTTAGLAAFTDACARHGIACISGVEMSVGDDRDLLHLLAYGFDPGNAALQEELARTRARRAGGGGADPAGRPGHAEIGPLVPAPEGPDERSWVRQLARAIRLVHDAGGRAFLAHPLGLVQDAEALDAVLEQARSVGLDGVEAYYWRHSDIERRTLQDLAGKHGLVVCGGSDYHGPERAGPLKPGIDLPGSLWKSFRDAVIASSPARAREPAPRHATPSAGEGAGAFVLRIVVPALLGIVLFVAAIFAILLPETERQLLERKRETIRELTRSAWSVLEEYQRLEQAGDLTREQARHEAVERIRGMRYGPERKDYFWLTDQHPRMIMHPYRTDLEGQDLSTYSDPNGVLLFVEFARQVRESKEGYLQYVWQWKDDPARLAPKESYVKGFEPWGWIIGTGLYVEDVRTEIGRLSSRFVSISVMISAAVMVLLLVMLQQSLRLERRRRATARALGESYEKYRALVEASTAATLLVIDHRCTTANVVAQEMLGYTPGEFALLDIVDLVEPPPPGADPGRDALARLLDGQDVPVPFEARLRRKDGGTREVVLTSSRVSFAGREGLIVNARDVSRQEQIEEALDVTRGRFKALTGNLDFGVFHADMSEGGRLLDLNEAGRRIFGLAAEGELPRASLVELFADPEDGVSFLRALRDLGSVRRRVVWMNRADGETVLVSLSATLARYGVRHRDFCDGLVEDVTERKRAEADRESVIAELQSSLLFLNEPLAHCVIDLPACGLGDTIESVAARMTREGRDAVAVTGEGGAVIGIVSDRDFRERVLVAKRDPRRPIHEIMSAPVVSIPQRALVYEALLLMQERSILHLAVRDEQDRVVSLVRAKDLVRFDRYSASVLTAQLRKAGSAEELAAGRRRLPVLVKGLIDSGTNIRAVTRVTTTVSDAIVERLIALACAEVGQPPVPFAFLALGSEGRGEQTLVTDQDNAIVFADTDPGSVESHRAWFVRLGTLVCDGLNTAGYAWCNGGLMAKNPRWTQPLSSWKRTFEQWVATCGPQELIDVNKFFDFRCVQGDQDLVTDLRAHVERAVRADASFLKFFAQNALIQKPPVGVFGQVQAGSGRTRPGTIDLKFVQMLIVGFARLYALRHGIRETNTADRLHRLHELGCTGTKQHRETTQAYEFLMRLRLAHQARAMTHDQLPDNDIDPGELTQIEQKMLKQILAQIVGMQARISHDFGLVS